MKPFVPRHLKTLIAAGLKGEWFAAAALRIAMRLETAQSLSF